MIVLRNPVLCQFMRIHGYETPVEIVVTAQPGSFGLYRSRCRTIELYPIGERGDRSWVQLRTTLIHELAHFRSPPVYDPQAGRWQKHTDSWREEYGWLMYQALQGGLFPSFEREALAAVTATNCSHTEICPRLQGALADLLSTGE